MAANLARQARRCVAAPAAVLQSATPVFGRSVVRTPTAPAAAQRLQHVEALPCTPSVSSCAVRWQSEHLEQVPVRGALRNAASNLWTLLTDRVATTVLQPYLELEAARALRLQELAAGTPSQALAMLGDTDAEVRLAAVSVLGSSAEASAEDGEFGEEAVASALAACTQDRDSRVRLSAVQALLGRAVSGQERAVAAVVARLRDGSEEVRCGALHVLTCLARSSGGRGAALAAAHLQAECWGLRYRSDEHRAAAAVLRQPRSA